MRRVTEGLPGIQLPYFCVHMCSVMWTVRLHRQQPTRLLCPRDFPGKNAGVVPFPSPGDLPDPGIKLMSPALAGRFFTTEPPGKLLSPQIWGHVRAITGPRTIHPSGLDESPVYIPLLRVVYTPGHTIPRHLDCHVSLFHLWRWFSH